MYTGYFAKLKEYEKAGLVPVSIAGKAPSWYHGLEYKKLAPKWFFFNEWKNGNHKGDNDYYISEFNKQVLEPLSPIKVVADLLDLTKVPEYKIILLCYEKPGDFCHRHLVADWITKFAPFMSICYIDSVKEWTGEEETIISSDKDIQQLVALDIKVLA